jgi:hypothetical protein
MKSVDSGFTSVSGFGIDFKHDYRSDPIIIGLMYDTALLKGNDADDIRIYQYDTTEQTYAIVDDCIVNTLEKRVYAKVKPSEYPHIFVLLIDTNPPVVKILSDTVSAVVYSNQDIYDTVEIKDNIINSRLKLVFWGNNGMGGDVAAVQSCTSSVGVVHTVIPHDSFSVDRGIKTEIVVTDGVHEQVIDISRCIERPASYPMSLPAMKWTPVITTAHLVKMNIEASLGGLSSGTTWKYDSLNFRIFRWIDTSNTSEGNVKKDFINWVEYASYNSGLFDMIPGRVVWVKSRNSKNIAMGKGVTVSMKKPYSITLKAKNWNDIALPYNIDIKLGDIFDASDSGEVIKESVLVYNWVNNDQSKTIVSSQKYIPALVGYDSVGTTLTYAAKEGEMATYTVYNTTSKDIQLIIPPIPEAFSTYASVSATNKRAVNMNHVKNAWSITVRARTDAGELSPVHCAFNDGSVKRVFPVPPSFSHQRLVVTDPERRSFSGCIIQNDPEKDGFVFPLLFENTGDAPAQFSYTITSVTGLPDLWQSILYDPVTKNNNATTGDLSVTVEANTGVYKMLVVGDSSYIASWTGAFIGKLSLLKMYPNPCRGRMNLRFTLPFVDVKQVNVSIYDQLGRRVWGKSISGRSLAFGENVVHFQPEARSRLSAGTYIIQISAIETSGKNIGTLRQRILYFP